MKGDSIDNVPGVPGIGDKGAAKLIQAYGTLEEILEHAEEVKNKRQREALGEHRKGRCSRRSWSRSGATSTFPWDSTTCGSRARIATRPSPCSRSSSSPRTCATTCRPPSPRTSRRASRSSRARRSSLRSSRGRRRRGSFRCGSISRRAHASIRGHASSAGWAWRSSPARASTRSSRRPTSFACSSPSFPTRRSRRWAMRSRSRSPSSRAGTSPIATLASTCASPPMC